MSEDMFIYRTSCAEKLLGEIAGQKKQHGNSMNRKENMTKFLVLTTAPDHENSVFWLRHTTISHFSTSENFCI